MEKVEYKKLTKRLRSILKIAQIWCSDDHLLCVEETFVAHSYRRLYFKDLEGIVIGNSIHQLAFITIWLIIGVITTLIIMSNASFSEPGSIIFSLIAVMIIAVFLTRELVGGETCYILFQTKNGPYKVPARLRLKNARKIIRLLIPLVSGVQNQPPQTGDSTPKVEEAPEL